GSTREMNRRVILSPAASDDIAGILDFALEQYGLEFALEVDARIHDQLPLLERMSTRGRLVPELRARGITSYRELVVPPYRIIYRVEAREVWVVGVFDHRRDLDSLLHERARRDLPRR